MPSAFAPCRVTPAPTARHVGQVGAACSASSSGMTIRASLAIQDCPAPRRAGPAPAWNFHVMWGRRNVVEAEHGLRIGHGSSSSCIGTGTHPAHSSRSIACRRLARVEEELPAAVRPWPRARRSNDRACWIRRVFQHDGAPPPRTSVRRRRHPPPEGEIFREGRVRGSGPTHVALPPLSQLPPSLRGHLPRRPRRDRGRRLVRGPRRARRPVCIRARGDAMTVRHPAAHAGLRAPQRAGPSRSTSTGSGVMIRRTGSCSRATRRRQCVGIFVTLYDKRQYVADLVGYGRAPTSRSSAQSSGPFTRRRSAAATRCAWEVGDRHRPSWTSSSVTAGVVSARGRRTSRATRSEAIQTDASVGPGPAIRHEGRGRQDQHRDLLPRPDGQRRGHLVHDPDQHGALGRRRAPRDGSFHVGMVSTTARLDRQPSASSARCFRGVGRPAEHAGLRRGVIVAVDGGRSGTAGLRGLVLARRRQSAGSRSSAGATCARCPW